MSTPAHLTSKGDARARLIIDATLRCLATDGYAGVSIQRIADEAGIPKRSVLYYYGSRDQLFAHVVPAIVTRFVEQIQASVAGLDSAPAIVDAGFHALWDALTRDRGLLIAWFGLQTEAITNPALQPVAEAATGRLRGLFAQRRNLLRPAFWRMLWDVRRFYGDMRGRGEDPALLGLTLGEVLERNGYGKAFCEQHLLPMAAAIWSGPVSAMLEFPAQSFIRFCDNHGLLQVGNRPAWRTVRGGSREYVRRLAAGISGPIHLHRPVRSLRRYPGGVAVETER